MKNALINNFDEFLSALYEAGFSLSGGSTEGGGIALSERFGSGVRWHTGEDTDPWRWRMRALSEKSDIAYAKVFLNKGGFIARQWYPYFLAIRRGGRSFGELYADGLLNAMAQRVYSAIDGSGQIAYHEIKRAIGIKRVDESKFAAALVQLQMYMLLTICGETYHINKQGMPYGWAVNVFTTPERLFGDSVIDEAMDLDRDDAINKITAQIRKHGSCDDENAVYKFITGQSLKYHSSTFMIMQSSTSSSGIAPPICSSKKIK
jgi:hypothetical protein